MQPDADGLGQENRLRTRSRGAHAAEVPSLPARVPVARCDLAMMYLRSFRNARSRVTCSLPARRCASWISGGSGSPGTMMRTLRPRTRCFRRRPAMRHVCATPQLTSHCGDTAQLNVKCPRRCRRTLLPLNGPEAQLLPAVKMKT